MEREIMGFRFNPTPEQLVNYHLKRKLQMINDEDRCMIPDVNIYEYDPGDLCAVYNEKCWKRSTSSDSFFFCPQKRRNTNSGSSKKCNYSRKAGDGYWKETSKKRGIKDEETGETIGTKRIYSFYYGNQNDHRETDWALHEYHLSAAVADNTIPDPTAFVLCHIKKKKMSQQANSKNQQTTSTASPCGEAEADASASAVTPGNTEEIAAQGKTPEGSALVMEGPQLLVAEQSPIISPSPSSELDRAYGFFNDPSYCFMDNPLENHIRGQDNIPAAAFHEKETMQSGTLPTEMSITDWPDWPDYPMRGTCDSSEGNFTSDNSDDDFNPDVFMNLWGGN
ncbi:protein NTM1-like 9 [Punica granatum]|uniref:NAC domain-containing protein n=2 Tax=Punica granatum TaxID=22663 RepID=A0A218VY14_PUNGR|nr:protein NTM1-like 9 [Punica granatum]OWM64762.1 hypothetical protein CDL15_Pgr028479 [Punica granatum]PKI51200.1 hypothetical protein CRG98_028407 [Punica granatum]